MSLEKAFAIIEEGKGTHFDPAVVEAFFDVQDEILTIRATYQDDDRSMLSHLAATRAKT